jgi:uncharacterized protein YcnI
MKLLIGFFFLAHQACAHLTIVPMAGACTSTGCNAGSSFYVQARMPHALPGNYTYKVSIKIPKAASATIKPEYKPGWTLTYNPDTDPTGRWIHYTALPGFEVYDKWVLLFQLQLAIKCGTSTAPLEFDDSLIVPMGNSSTGTVFYGLLLPTRQYLCEMSGGKCVPNGRVEDWAGFNSDGYNSNVAKCATTAVTTPGSCDSSCKGSTMPCISFKIPSPSSCGVVSLKNGVSYGNMDAPGEGGNFPSPTTTRRSLPDFYLA